jgi:hypothetical protein
MRVGPNCTSSSATDVIMEAAHVRRNNEFAGVGSTGVHSRQTKTKTHRGGYP